MNSIQTAYPRLPDILDEEMLASVATLESRERTFARSKGRVRQNYLRALYLKAFLALGHGRVQPIELPRQFRLSIIEQLGGAKELADIRTIDRRERSRILVDVRAFVDVRAATAATKNEVRAWLSANLAGREGDIAVLTNAAIDRFRQTHVELPPLEEISALAERALYEANTTIENTISKALSKPHGTRLMSLIDGTAPKLFARIKQPPAAASPLALQRELERFNVIDSLMPNREALAVNRRKIEQLAHLAKRYHTAELLQLRRAKGRAVLACFVAVRRAEMLDELADMFIRIWDNVKSTASTHADQVLKAIEEEREDHGALWREVLQMIRSCRSPAELWHAIHARDDRLEALSDRMVETTSRNR